MPLNVIPGDKLSSEYQGIGTVKMRDKKRRGSGLAADNAPAASYSPMALLQTATASIVAPLGGKHKMEPVPGNIGLPEEDDDSDNELLDDDGLSSTSSEDDEFEDALEEEDESQLHDSPPPISMTGAEAHPDTADGKTAGLPPPPKTAALAPPDTKGTRTPTRQSSLPGYFDRPSRDQSPGPSTPGAVTPGGTKLKKPLFKRTKSAAPSRKSTRDFNFDATQGKEVLGIVIMEIKGATDLPRIKNCKSIT